MAAAIRDIINSTQGIATLLPKALYLARRAGDVCPAVRKALEPFALQRCEAANEVMCFRTGCVDDTLILTDVLITDTFFISAA